MQQVQIIQSQFLSGNQKEHVDATVVNPEKTAVAMPGAIFIHGMTSKKDGYIEIAKALAEKGISSMAMSLRGHGDSQGDFKTLTIQDGVVDGLSAFDFFVKQSGIDKERIGLCGASFGGAISALVSQQRRVRSLILRAPATYTQEMMHMTLEQIMTYEGTTFKEMKNISETPPLQAIAKFKGNLLVIKSEHDAIIPARMVDAYVDNAKKARHTKNVTIRDATHPLTDPKWKQEFIAQVSRWFGETL